jgi:competence protein ComEC
MGMLLGDTNGIEEGLYKNIRYGGVAHIFAVSGLHVGALFGFCLLIIGRIKNSPKFFRWILVAVVLFFYAGVCGYSESVVRAMVICLVFYAFRLFNLQSDFLEGLGVAAIIVLVRNPVALFDIGCQLSFGACMGIAFVSSPMQRSINAWFDGKRKKAALLRGEEEVPPPGIATRFRRAFVSFFTVTLGAQIFTLPIMLSSFSYVSVWALALNCFFTPFISAIFSFLLLFVFLACCFPILFSRVLLFIPNLLISFSMLLFEVTDFSTLSISFVIPVSLNLSYYTAVLLASDKFNLKKGYKWAMVSVCFLAFVVTVFALNM